MTPKMIRNRNHPNGITFSLGKGVGGRQTEKTKYKDFKTKIREKGGELKQKYKDLKQKAKIRLQAKGLNKQHKHTF